MPLRISFQNEELPNFVEVSIAIINPFSQNTELAMEFLEFLTQNRMTSMEIAFKPANSKPVRNEEVTQTLQEMQKDCDLLEASIPALPPDEQKLKTAELETMRETMNNYEKLWGWIVDERALSEWKDLCKNMRVLEYSGIFENGDVRPNLENLCIEFIEGVISPEAFAGKLDSMLYMRQMEGN